MAVLAATLSALNINTSASQIVSPLPWQIYDSWFAPVMDVSIEPPSDVHRIRIYRSWPGGEDEVLQRIVENPDGGTFVEMDITSLPCGQYRVEVDTRNESLNSGPFMVISDIPQVRVTRPDHQSISGRGDRVLIKWDVLERTPWYSTDFTICIHGPQGAHIGCDSLVEHLNPREATWKVLSHTSPGYYDITVSTLNNPGNYGGGQVLIDAWNTPEFKIRLRSQNESVLILDVISRNESVFRFLDLEYSSNLRNWRTMGIVSPGSWYIPNDTEAKFFRLRLH